MGPDERTIMRALLMHKWEEVEHRVWPLDGYKSLGGDQSRIGREAEFTSPGAFAVAAVWERLARLVNPLAYLGAEYLFEDLTARLTKLVNEKMSKRGFPTQGMRFLVDHATEDEKHSNLLRKLIHDVVQRHPELAPQMLFAFDCFQHVYPIHCGLNLSPGHKRLIVL
jgi:pyrroloquinoline quinone (PQQ) biosynthesis protein C